MTETVRVDRGGGEVGGVEYEQRDDGWYVRTPDDDEFWKFAYPGADARTVRQLINKKWSDGYGEPDAWDDRS